ncbi:MAG: hypothetical protein ACFFDH_14575 [Promethearchaeota archaeon]
MTESEDIKNFSCPKCGKIGTITFIKAVGDNFLIKHKCPIHEERSFKVPLLQKERYLPHFRNGIFRCHICGGEAAVKSAKASGPWMLVKCTCPMDGNKLPVQKIWSTIYTDISLKESPEPEPIHPISLQTDEKKFCPNCGTPLKEAGDFCDACGTKIV